MVPLSAHALFARPLVVAPTSVLAVELAPGTPPGVLWCDGRRTSDLEPGDRVESRRSPEPLRLARHPPQAVHRPAGPQVRPARRRVARTVRAPVIEELRIRGLGVIDDAVLELDPGLTVVTGETGAGKTMVVTGLGPAPGRSGRRWRGPYRGRPRTRRGPAAASTRRRRRSRSPTRPAPSWRTVRSCWPARSRPRVARGHGSAAAAVPVGTLADSAPSSWPCTGSPTSWRLLAPARQRAALDRYAGEAVGDPVARVRRDVRAVRGGRGRARDIRTERARRRQEAERAPRRASTEVAAVAPAAGEDADLDAEAERLEHADALAQRRADGPRRAARRPGVGRRADALGLVAAARRALEHDARPRPGAGRPRRPAGRGGRPRGAGRPPTSPRTSTASTPTRPGSQPCTTDAPPSRGSPARTARHLADVLVWAKEATERLDAAGRRRRARRGAGRARRRSCGSAWRTSAGTVSAARRAAAESFAAAVSDELTDLAMPDARVEAALEQVDDPDGLDGGPSGAPGRRLRFGPHGVDDVSSVAGRPPGRSRPSAGQGRLGW